jgi:hypothetical protein
MTTGSAIGHFTLDVHDLEWTGHELQRPESVVAGPRLQFPTSPCSACEDLPTAYVRSLTMQRLPTFRSPVPGLPMSHWR